MSKTKEQNQKKGQTAGLSQSMKMWLFGGMNPTAENRPKASITNPEAPADLRYGIWESDKIREERRWREDANKPKHRPDRNEEEDKKRAFDVLIPRLQKEGASPAAIVNIMANIQAESSFDYGANENMRYKAKQLKEMKRFKDMPESELAKISGKPFEVAQRMYGTREDWVSDNPYKGVAYRGRGYIQLSDPRNYKVLTEHLNKKGINVDLLKNPELVNQDPEIAAEAAIFYLKRNAPGGRLSAYEDINNTFAAIRFSGWDQPEGEKDRQRRIANAERLKPEIEAYLNPPKPDKKQSKQPKSKKVA